AMRNIGYALQQRMARGFGGDAQAMRRACVARMARSLQVKPERLSPAGQNAFADFAMVLSLIPGLPGWTPEEKAALRAIIAAKAAPHEQRYLRLLQKHARL